MPSTAAIERPGSAIGLTAGTTTWTFAKKLLDYSDLTVVTNAPAIAQLLYGNTQSDMTLVSTGGIRTPSDALIGPVATQSMSKLHLDAVFMGIHGMDTGLGFTTPNLAEAETNAAFVHSCRKLIVLADHTKWGIAGLAQIAPWSAADVVISDDRLPAEARRELEDRGVEVCLVEADAV